MKSLSPAASSDSDLVTFGRVRDLLRLWSVMEYQGQWSPSASYLKGDVTSWQGQLYSAKVDVAPGAAPVIVGSRGYRWDSSGTSSQVVLPLPAGSAVGDLAVLAFGGRNAFTLPAGWTAIPGASTVGSNGTQATLGYKLLTAPDIAAVNVTIASQSVASGLGIALYVLRNVDTLGGAAVSTNLTAPGIALGSIPAIVFQGMAGTFYSGGAAAVVTSTPQLQNILNELNQNGVDGGLYIGASVVSTSPAIPIAFTQNLSNYGTQPFTVWFYSAVPLVPNPVQWEPIGATATYVASAVAAGLTSAQIYADSLRARAAVSATSASLAQNANDTATTVALGKAYRLFSIQTSKVARVRLYATAAQQAADLSRAIGTDPAADAGVILDFVTTDTSVHSLSPLVDGASLESTPSINIPMTVQNLAASTGAVTVTFMGVRVE